MPIFIAFLRGINVSGQKIIKMADLKVALETAGFQTVQTYIQSGNIVLETEKMEIAVLEQKITEKIKEVFGFDVPALVRTLGDLETILENNPFSQRVLEEKDQLYFTLLKTEPTVENQRKLESKMSEIDEIRVLGQTVYVLCRKGYGESMFSNNFVEKILQISATTRNLATVQKMIGLGKKA